MEKRSFCLIRLSAAFFQSGAASQRVVPILVCVLLAAIPATSALAQISPGKPKDGVKGIEAPKEPLDLYGDSLPERAIARMGSIRARHGDLVRSIAVRPDGKFVATAGGGHYDRQDVIRIWDVAGGKLVRSLSGHTSRINSMVFSPDGKRLASGGGGNTLLFWDLTTGKVVRTVDVGMQRIEGLAYAPDGETLATAATTAIVLRDAVTGREIRTLDSDKKWYHRVAFSPSGKMLAALRTGGGDSDDISLWDIKTGKRIRDLCTVDHPDKFASISFAPNGSLLAVGLNRRYAGGGGVWVYNVHEGRRLSSLIGHSSGVVGLAFSPSDETLATCSWDGTLRLWDPPSGQLLAQHRTLFDPFYRLVFLPDGNAIAAAGGDGVVRFLDARTLEPRRPLHGHGAPVNVTAFSPDGLILATGSSDHTLRLWDAGSGRELRKLQCNAPVEMIDFAPDGKLVTCALRGGEIRSWNVNTGELAETYKADMRHVRAMVIGPDGRKAVAVGSEGNMITLHLDEKRSPEIKPLATDGPPEIIASWISPDLKLIAVSQPCRKTGGIITNIITDENHILRLYRLDTGARVLEKNVYAKAVTVSPTLDVLAYRGFSGFKVLEVLSGSLVTRGSGGRGRITAGPVFSPDGLALAIGDGQGIITVWNAITGKLVATFTGHYGPVLSISFSRDSKYLASASADTTALVWDMSNY